MICPTSLGRFSSMQSASDFSRRDSDGDTRGDAYSDGTEVAPPLFDSSP